MGQKDSSSKSGFDKYVNYRTLAIAVCAFVLLLLIPTPDSMLDVAVEYTAGQPRVRELFARDLFGNTYDELEQWQAMSVAVLEQNMRRGAMSRSFSMNMSTEHIRELGINSTNEHVERFRARLREFDDASFRALMMNAHRFRHEDLRFDDLSEQEQRAASSAATKLKVCLAMTAFVVICFLTEAIPLPGVAFCIGLILVLARIVSYRDIASLFWSDACWFIMGSLMFAAALVKTGVDRRICLFLFSRLARPSVKVVTAIMIMVISPAAAFISDHALAAMFLPVAMILYSNSLTRSVTKDSELAKMLIICVAMACNIGGFGAPSGGARNVIMIGYMEDMFGINFGYGEWMLYGFPFVLIMMPVLWLLLNLRFKPKLRDLGPALQMLRADIARMGGWSAKQITALVIFLVMLLGWITDSSLLSALLGTRLGIGVIAVMGAVAYLMTGIVSWRDYQEKVDWGVVWLYAGAIAFGRALDTTGTAYWMARSVVEGLASLGASGGEVLLCIGALVTGGITNLMADGPAAASVGPITLNMAAVRAPGSSLVPYMGLITAASSSFAYLLIIGTPPNAIVYASGHLQARDYLRVGLPCFLLALVLIMVLALVYWPLLGAPPLPGQGIQ